MPLSLASQHRHPAGGWSFLPFPGVDRVITLLAGQPLRLRGEDIDHPLALWQPWAFPGEWALSSVGIVEPGLDFNIMTQRGRASARLKW
jgi:environmental stress-induced protein Ves